MQLQRTMSASAATRAPDARTEITEDTSTDFGSQNYMFLRPEKTISLVRECTFAEFKNRFRKRDGRYAVDVFMSGHLMHQEMQEEYRLRDRLFQQRAPVPSGKIVNTGDKALASVVKIANATNELILQAQQDEKWPRRIRIQSPALLRILAKVNRETWSDRPRTYYRPFNSLIHHHSRVKEALEELENKWGSELPADSNDETTYVAGAAKVAHSNEDSTDHPENHTDEEEDESTEEESDTSADDGENEDDYESVSDCPKALECLRAYVKYIDNKIMPDYRRFEKEDVSSKSKVRFSDLWFLFRTGELVYRQVEGELPDRRDFRTGKHIWKTHKIISVPEKVAVSATDDTEIKDSAVGNDDNAFTLECFYIDYTGDEFCVVTKTFEIEQFPGEIPVTALSIYPMRFCQDHAARRRHAEQTGRSLIEFIKTKHCSYNGWTLTQDPSGDPTTDVNGLQQHQPEHINSEVMVDFGEAFQACPSWRPARNILRSEADDGLTLPDDFRIRWWSGADRARLIGETTELLPIKSGVASRQYNKFIKEDPFLKAVAENSRRAKPTKADQLDDDCLALLTGRVFAYVFQERKFAQLAVAKLRQSPKTGLALDSLKIPPAIKQAIQGSIQGHLIKKAAERNMDHSWVSLDLIRGKGTGLFILLHGVPGVGKTATAEAIAEANGKPLFSITVGDLGMTPEKLESSLREIFRLASIWNCILLLDEVDTFFSQRSKADTATTKNALVSVFLRVLDYYDGILFLTTNRAGVLDEAFKSRIHYKIYYPELSLEQSLDIWKLNIHRVRQLEEEMSKTEERPPLSIDDRDLLDFARRHFNHGSARWNGRQIRNAFQVALSLAYYEYRGGGVESKAAEPKAPTLSVKHFETMHAITTSFEHYRNTVRDATDSELALHAETRNDRFTDRLTQHWQREYRELSLREAEVASGVDNDAGFEDSGVPNPLPRQGGVGLGMGADSVSGSRVRPGPSPGMRPRSSSQLSGSSPPNTAAWRAPAPQGGRPPRHIPSHDSLNPGGGNNYPSRSPNPSYGSSPGPQYNNGYHLSPGLGSRGNYNDGDRTVQINSSTPRGRSPMNMGGERSYTEHQLPPRYYEHRDSMGGHRDSTTEWDDQDYPGPEQYGGHRDSVTRPGPGQGMGAGFSETDLRL
ncbi:hypothetical protein B0T16DRAFT_415470 [Cercophora newfieldiana]|uniref:AAA+ ATPase domain-containing protein n=1 Tax=Cercophora newfieldiana TaxID=92897 RepID=A0AA39XZI1_9PEZI|nr:hypothetical protein B0T16DRAFT_415470 [Cercophora newfieldiana]